MNISFSVNPIEFPVMWLHSKGTTMLFFFYSEWLNTNSLCAGRVPSSPSVQSKNTVLFLLPLSLYHFNCTHMWNFSAKGFLNTTIALIQWFPGGIFLFQRHLFDFLHILLKTTDNHHLYIGVYKYIQFLLEFGKDNDIPEEEQVSLLGLRALGNLSTLVQQQLSVLTGEAEDEWTLLHRDPAGSLLPEGRGHTWKEGWVTGTTPQPRPA